MSNSSFEEFPKMARLSRECVITEKIDGTNAQVFIEDLSGMNLRDFPSHHKIFGRDEWEAPAICVVTEDQRVYALSAGSRSRYITPDDDNYGFARWAYEHADELVTGLGPGRHYGEWWGSGVNRGYGLTKGEKQFSLFNTGRWKDRRLERDTLWKRADRTQVPYCCSVVPILATGIFSEGLVEAALDDLRTLGSSAAPWFTRPEGVVIYHTAAGAYFKKTLEKDEVPKGKVQK